MPELAKPASLLGSILKEQRSSKSPTVPLVQIKNVLPLMGASAVVRPRMAPSITDHSLGLPSHPERSLSLKIGLKPLSAAVTKRAELKSRTPVTREAGKCCFIIKGMVDDLVALLGL